MAQGFTLIELLIVITVLGVLAAIVIFALGGITSKSAVAACNADANTVETAVQAYDAETGGTVPVTPQLLTSATVPYLESFPTSSYFAISLDSGNVMIAAPIGATPVSYGTPNACVGAGDASSLTTTTPASTTTSSTTSTTTTPASTTTSSTTSTTTTPASTTTSSTTSTTSTTTTLAPSNGVSVVATSNNSNAYSGTETLTFTNTHPITALSVTISVARTTGLSEANLWNSFPGDLTQKGRTSSKTITYTWTLKGSAAPAQNSNDEVTAQWSGNGTFHPVSGDSWSVTSTSNGSKSTLKGSF